MLRFRQFLNEQLLLSGGGFGHLDNVYDINYTFSAMKNIIKTSLAGKLEMARVKTDGQNLMFSVINGELRAARNKGHLKNSGAASLTIDSLAAKFKGRGGLEYAYNNAMKDINDAVSKLSDKQIQKIFKNGRKFMSMEVIHTDSPNLVWYGHNQLRFHGTREYDDDGNIVGDEKKDADILAGMIKQRGKDKGETFDIASLVDPKLKPTPNLPAVQKSFISDLDSILSKYKLSGSHKMNDYKERYFKALLKKHGIVNDKLLKRWAFLDKSYSVANIKKDNYNTKQMKWVLDFDKTKLKDEYKEMMLPFEILFLKLGAVVLKNIRQFMVLDPNKSIRFMAKKVETAIKAVEASDNPKLIKKVALELRRLEAIGGSKMASAEEGVTFIGPGGHFLKLTGNFAVNNQLTGLLFQLEP